MLDSSKTSFFAKNICRTSSSIMLTFKNRWKTMWDRIRLLSTSSVEKELYLLSTISTLSEIHAIRGKTAIEHTIDIQSSLKLNYFYLLFYNLNLLIIRRSWSAQIDLFTYWWLQKEIFGINEVLRLFVRIFVQ